MEGKEKVYTTKIYTSRIDELYSTGGAEAAITAVRELAQMRVRSKVPDFDIFQQDELIQNILISARSGKFKGFNSDRKPVRYSSWVYQIASNLINRSLRDYIRKRKRSNPTLDLALLEGKDRELAFEVFSLREKGMTYKQIAPKLNADNFLPKKTNHVALRRRISRLYKQMEVLPEDNGDNGGRLVATGSKTRVGYAE